MCDHFEFSTYTIHSVQCTYSTPLHLYLNSEMHMFIILCFYNSDVKRYNIKLLLVCTELYKYLHIHGQCM